jgi:hypothetical protein
VLLVLVAGAYSVACSARSASPEEVRELAGRALPALSWWAGFHEPAFEPLHEAVRARTLQQPAADQVRAQAQVLDAYVAARVLNIRWNLAREFGDVLDEQATLLKAARPTTGNAELLSGIAVRRSEAARFANGLLRQRDTIVVALASWCGVSADGMGTLLAHAFALRELPLFDAPTPTRLPRAVLRGRADVSVAESRLLLARKGPGSAAASRAAGVSALMGWIELEPTAAVPAADLPDAEELVEVLAQAEADVRGKLRELQQRGSEAARRLEISRMRRVELDAALRRAQLGAGSGREVVQDYQRLLTDNDQLAIAGGALASSWIALQLSTAGRAFEAGTTGEP